MIPCCKVNTRFWTLNEFRNSLLYRPTFLTFSALRPELKLQAFMITCQPSLAPSLEATTLMQLSVTTRNHIDKLLVKHLQNCRLVESVRTYATSLTLDHARSPTLTPPGSLPSHHDAEPHCSCYCAHHTTRDKTPNSTLVKRAT